MLPEIFAEGSSLTARRLRRGSKDLRHTVRRQDAIFVGADRHVMNHGIEPIERT